MTGAQEINRQRIRWAGVVTFASIILVFVSDMGLMGLPVSGAELAELGLSAMESRLPAGLIYLSSFGAITTLTPFLAGSLILYEGLRPIGMRRALPPLLLITAFIHLGTPITFGEAIFLWRRVGDRNGGVAPT